MEILNNVTYLWLIAGAILVIAEFIILPGVGFLFAGLGAIITGALLEFGLIGGPMIPWVVFFVATLAWTLILWKPLKNYKLNHGEAAQFSDVIGKKAVLLKPLAPGMTGQARWSGTIMNAKLDPNNTATLMEGTEVTITRVEGNVLVVK